MPALPGAPCVGAIHVRASSSERNTSIPDPENCRVARYVLPDALLRASTGSPTSPLGLVGRVPPSAQFVPKLVDREKPVNLLAPPRNEPESLNDEITLVPDPSTMVVSLCVSCAVVSAAGSFTRLLASAIAGCGLPSGPLLLLAAGRFALVLDCFPGEPVKSFFPNFNSRSVRAAPDSWLQ